MSQPAPALPKVTDADLAAIWPTYEWKSTEDNSVHMAKDMETLKRRIDEDREALAARKAESDAFLATIKELEADRARLDWMDTHCTLSQNPKHEWFLHFLKMGSETNNPLRAMVDAAMQSRP